MKNEIKAWLTEEDARQLADVYAQNASKAQAEAVPNGKDPFKPSYDGAEVEDEHSYEGDGDEDEDEYPYDDELR